MYDLVSCHADSYKFTGTPYEGDSADGRPIVGAQIYLEQFGRRERCTVGMMVESVIWGRIIMNLHMKFVFGVSRSARKIGGNGQSDEMINRGTNVH